VQSPSLVAGDAAIAAIGRRSAAVHRRDFLAILSGGGFAAHAFATGVAAPANGARIWTVAGPIAPEGLGTTLVHEHVMVDFIGAAAASRDRYDAGEVFEVALPYLRRIGELGCRTLVECTPAYIGRDPALLKRLSTASGIQIVTNTGYYGAAGGKFVPAHAAAESAEQLARRWSTEFEQGIEATGIRPGFIKIGVNKGPLSDVDAKLVRAAALTHRATGLTIASHTGDGAAAIEQLEILDSAGVSAEAFIWVHAQNETSGEVHVRAAEHGAWLEFEGFGSSSIKTRAAQVAALAKRGLLNHVLVSLDAGWYRVGEPGGGKFAPYDTFFTAVLPALRDAGLLPEQIRLLTDENPRRALTVSARLRPPARGG